MHLLYVMSFPLLMLSVSVRLGSVLITNMSKSQWIYTARVYFSLLRIHLTHREAICLVVTQQSYSTNSTQVLLCDWTKLYNSFHCLGPDVRKVAGINKWTHLTAMCWGLSPCTHRNLPSFLPVETPPTIIISLTLSPIFTPSSHQLGNTHRLF